MQILPVTTSEEAFNGAIFFFFAGTSYEEAVEVRTRSPVRMHVAFIISGFFRAGR